MINMCSGLTLKDLANKHALVVTTALDRDKEGKPYSCLMLAKKTPIETMLAYYQNT